MKKLLFMFLSLFFIVFFSVPPITFAQQPAPTAPSQTQPSTWYNQDIREWYIKVYDDKNPTEIFGERYTAAQVQWIFYSILTLPFSKAHNYLTCSFSGDLSECRDVADQTIAQADNLMFLAESKENDKTLNPSFNSSGISGVAYVKDKIDNFSIAKKANAQGFGYTALQSVVIPPWRSIRNFSYTLLVLVTIYFAFMIMFRQKVGAQTALNIQQAIPKLIITILLITFSYAVAGFMVDIMYVVSALIVWVVQNALTPMGIGNLLDTPMWNLFVGEYKGLGFFFFILIYTGLFSLASFISILAFFVSSLTDSLLGSGIFTLLSPLLTGITLIVSLLIVVVILFMVIISIFKMTISLIKSVANIYMQIIFSPLIILGGNFSNNFSFASWIKNLMGQLAVFPVIITLLWLSVWFLLFALSASFTSVGANTSTLTSFINDHFGMAILPASTSWSPPLLGQGWAGIIFLGASLTVLRLIPKAADLAKNIFSGQAKAPELASLGDYMKSLSTIYQGGIKVYQTGVGYREAITNAVAGIRAARGGQGGGQPAGPPNPNGEDNQNQDVA